MGLFFCTKKMYETGGSAEVGACFYSAYVFTNLQIKENNFRFAIPKFGEFFLAEIQTQVAGVSMPVND
jgi:hypothetical protein